MFLRTLEIAGSGLTAQRLKMDVAANNLANAYSNVKDKSGQIFKRHIVELEESKGKDGSFLGVKVAGIVSDNSPPRMVYDPGNPEANADGYVEYPNVNPIREMVSLINASRSYEADLNVISATKSMIGRTLDQLR
ncbi:flagellar basal-body rod protein FlgC [Thermodesulfobium acidiphilum]|uniref:Flagellar basal-body rod protein FlgC n=1 Tax=Thermodesulfobium acidiphilum TaxID=1794699 RepID=A0A2R4W2V0_THEAF|nr:flagellar basal body rod protein FlgC [Thermodesulfobium acidiphilum]AWB10992.1 flagellar basal-body rod protein FlgC [Thermodesulfobium acidiphilum]